MMMQPSPLYSRRTSFDDELLEDVSLSPLYVDYDLDCSSASSCSTQQQTSTASHNDSLLQDQLVALVSMEDSYRVQPSPPCLNATTTTPSSYDGWRRAICEWSYRVVDHFHVNRAAVGVALNLLDRYLVLRQVPRNSQVGDCSCPSCQRSVSSKLFQLAAMTALYIAVKLHVCEGSSEELFCAKSRRTKKLRLLSFVDLSRGQFTSQDITTMEKTMLHTLQFKVHPPTPCGVVSMMLQLLPSSSSSSSTISTLLIRVITEIARYLSEVSVCLHDLSSYSPSDIAYAAILASMDMLVESGASAQLHNDVDSLVKMLQSSNNDHHKFDLSTALQLKSTLVANFSPEMLLEDCCQQDTTSTGSSAHPIKMALEQGLIHLYQKKKRTQVQSASPKGDKRAVQRKTSATSVINAAMNRQQAHEDDDEDEWMVSVVTP